MLVDYGDEQGNSNYNISPNQAVLHYAKETDENAKDLFNKLSKQINKDNLGYTLETIFYDSKEEDDELRNAQFLNTIKQLIARRQTRNNRIPRKFSSGLQGVWGVPGK
jgi:hypothetical protein